METKGEQNMKKHMIIFCALVMAAMMTASPVSRVRAAEGVKGAKAAGETQSGTELVRGEKTDAAGDDGLTTYELSDRVYIVTVRSAEVRRGPGAGYSVVGILKRKTKVQGKPFGKEWVQIEYASKTAYVRKSCLSKYL